jgi:hypothetical protein
MGKVGSQSLVASDECDDKPRFDGFRLALAVPLEAEGLQWFG